MQLQTPLEHAASVRDSTLPTFLCFQPRAALVVFEPMHHRQHYDGWLTFDSLFYTIENITLMEDGTKIQ